MDKRITYYDKELDSYILLYEMQKWDKWDLINYIGLLEDKIMELKNGINIETTSGT